ncbi:tyrosine-type recombinase/integrase [Microcoleus sp. F10-C6]|uniref:tyrosine-type recombinase/integrase n=1 Tax=unclassified Microcoleus TaxID=2642155 RepID=UPI002FCE6BD8
MKEIQAIVEKFGSDPELQHFLDYLKVKFCTGLPTGEVAAWRRRHCSSECDRIWIGETLTGSGENRKPKAAKRNKNRTVPLTLQLQKLLLNRRPEAWQTEQKDDPIFSSVEGCTINCKNFCNRYWKPALADLGIDYRKPYITQHSLISHALESGMNSVGIAALTGHGVRTLYERYAGIVNPPQLPELLPLFSSCDDS